MELTPAYLAMTPAEKWETLVLNGLIGTDEPWIDDMRQSLRATPTRDQIVAETTAGIAATLWGNGPVPPGIWRFDTRPTQSSATNISPQLKAGMARVWECR